MQAANPLGDLMARSFFDANPHASLVFDAAGTVLHANAAAAWLTSDGSYPSLLHLAGTAWNTETPNRHAPLQGWNRRLRVRAADGSARQVDASFFAAQTPIGAPALGFLVLRDVSEEVVAARASQGLESRARVSADSAPVLIWMAGPDTSRDWFNKSWLAFRGQTLGEELDGGWARGVHPEDVERCRAISEASFEERAPFRMDYRLQRHDGAYRWLLDTAIPRWSDAAGFLGYIGSCLDITDRKELEDKLAERTRTLRLTDRRREEFLARLSHELRDPLGPIANAAAILRKVEGADRNLVMVREIIERQVEQLRLLITDLVDVTLITKGQVVLQRERLEIDVLVDRAVQVVGPDITRRQQYLRVERPPPGLTADGDMQRLVQALVALLHNASKFSADGSTILLSSNTLDGDLTLTVRDPGRGIASEVLPHVFELFMQEDQALAREDGGLGVGLTIAKRVAELHGGSVQVTSAGCGRGTQASIRFPVHDAATPATAGTDDRCDIAAVKGRRVLIVEDNADARESLRLLVELGGNDVRTAADAVEGLRVIQSFIPDLVVCDIGLPQTDGYALVPLLRERLAGGSTRIVALTGYARPEDKERALHSGFDEFLVKPLRPASTRAHLNVDVNGLAQPSPEQ